MDYSVIVSLKEKEQISETVLQAWLDTFSSLAIEERFEIIVVSQHQDDITQSRYRSLVLKYPFLSIIKLRRKATTSMATTIGMRAASGKYVITGFSGLKTPFASLAHSLKKVAQGYDLVVTRARSYGTDLMVCKQPVIQYIQAYSRIDKQILAIAQHEQLKYYILETTFPSLSVKIKNWVDRQYLNALTKPSNVFLLLAGIAILSGTLTGLLSLFVLGINAGLIALALILAMSHFKKPSVEQQVRHEIEEILGSVQAKQKVTYGLLSNQMKQAS